MAEGLVPLVGAWADQDAARWAVPGEILYRARGHDSRQSASVDAVELQVALPESFQPPDVQWLVPHRAAADELSAALPEEDGRQ